jgi:hypothetical protein
VVHDPIDFDVVAHIQIFPVVIFAHGPGLRELVTAKEGAFGDDEAGQFSGMLKERQKGKNLEASHCCPDGAR